MENNNDVLIFKEEMLKNIRDLEEKLTDQINAKHCELLTNIESYQQKINYIIDTNKSALDVLSNQKLHQEKITEFINFKNKVDAMLITHEIRINNSLKDIEKMRVKYDQIISENLLVPGYIGSSCQFRNVSDCLKNIIQDLSKNKIDKDNMKKDMKDLKNKYDSMFKTMVNLNDVSVMRCKEYTDNKEKDINNFVEMKINNFDDKIMEIRMSICTLKDENNAKFNENDEKIKQLQEQKSEIINIIDDRIEKIKEFEDLLHKKVILNIQDISINKNKIESLENKTNQSINDIYLKIKNCQGNKTIGKELISNNQSNLSPTSIPRTNNNKNDSLLFYSPKHEKIINLNLNNNEINKPKQVSRNGEINQKNSKNSGNSKIDDEDDTINMDNKILNKINILKKNKVKNILFSDYSERKNSITYTNYNNTKKNNFKNKNINSPSVNISKNNYIKQQNDDKKINNEIEKKYFNNDNVSNNKTIKKINEHVNKSELFKLKTFSPIKIDSKAKIINADIKPKNKKENDNLLEKVKNDSINSFYNIESNNNNNQLSKKIKINLSLYNRLNKNNVLDLYTYSTSPPEGMDLNLYTLQYYNDPNLLNNIKKVEPETGTECKFVSLGMYKTYSNKFKNLQKGNIKNDKVNMHKTSNSFNLKDNLSVKANNASFKTLYAYYNKKDKDIVDCSKRNKKQKNTNINNIKNCLSEGNI